MTESKKRIPVLTLTDFDLKVADAIVRTGSVKHAAYDLGVNVRLLYNRAYQIRKQFRKAMIFHNRVLAQRRRSAKLDRFWRPNPTLHEGQEEDEDVE
jgi:hypothetical protein